MNTVTVRPVFLQNNLTSHPLNLSLPLPLPSSRGARAASGNGDGAEEEEWHYRRLQCGTVVGRV